MPLVHCTPTIIQPNVDCNHFEKLLKLILIGINLLLKTFLFLRLLVIIICDHKRYRKALLIACRLGMCNGEYVFIDPYVLYGDYEYYGWLAGDEDDELARQAYRHVIKVIHFLYFPQQRYCDASKGRWA